VGNRKFISSLCSLCLCGKNFYNAVGGFGFTYMKTKKNGSQKADQVVNNSDSENHVCLKTVELSKSYLSGQEELQVLRDVDLTVKKGEFITIVGVSGSGKTTLLNLLSALDRPTNGTVIYEDQDIFKLNDKDLAKFRNQEIGLIFQFHHLMPEFTAIENVMMPTLIARMDREESQNSAKKLLQIVGLEGREHHRPTELSGGEQQRVAVARALINNPKVILADEPTGNLDRKTGESIHDLICNLNREMNLTFIIVTHNESLAQRSDKTIRLTDGKVEVLKGD
jgi:lipoprotein-releasing system ATP-binding protein